MSKFSKKIVLASSSPRRKELLDEYGYEFEIVAPDESAEDKMLPGELPSEYVARLSFQKALNVAKRFEEGLFLGCDTVAELEGKVLGKPVDQEHARSMLQSLSGKTHRVMSGVTLVDQATGVKRTSIDTTILEMATLTDEMLDEYLATQLWEGKAGSFGLQDGIDWVTVVEGSESNVVGLPMELVAEMLGAFA